MKRKYFKCIELLLTASLALGCGTWIGSPDEEDEQTNKKQDEQTNKNQDEFPEAASAPDFNNPLTDGIWAKLELPANEEKAECENFTINYRAEEEAPKILELANANQEDENTISFETTLPDSSLETIELVNLEEAGNYKVSVSYNNGELVTGCVLYLDLLELNDDESYKLEFNFD